MKECFVVRYADDFKILCSNYQTAKKIFYATKDFLKTRLGLDISPQKSKVINLKKQGSEFLGIKIKAVAKCKKLVAQSKMTEKAKGNAKAKIKLEIRRIQKNPNADTVWNFNSVVMGIHNYYSVASNISLDLAEINNSLRMALYNRLRKNFAEASTADMTKTLKKRYGSYKPKLWKIQGMVLIPIYAQKTKPAMNFSQNICNYTVMGRKKIHEGLKSINKRVLELLMKSFIRDTSIEYNDNRISKFIAQYGKCSISKRILGIEEIHCHHITPKEYGGDDSYQNLTIIHKDLHKLVHMKDEGKIIPLLKSFNLNNEQISKLNKLREKAHRKVI